MTNNPLFPGGSGNDQVDQSKSHEKRIKRPHEEERNAAADMIRRKINSLYEDEPNAEEEINEVEEESPKQRSKHQQYMHELSNSGKSLAQIQTEWHNYYINLSANEKKQVWQEFYEANGKAPQFFQKVANKVQSTKELTPPHNFQLPINPNQETKVVVAEHAYVPPKQTDRRSPKRIRRDIVNRITANNQLTIKDHFRSLLFGLSMGLIVLIIFIFGFFNEVFIAPFIQPSRNAGTIPVIIDDATLADVKTPEVIIPKINVEIPVDYSQTSDDETAIESALNNGIVHYPSTVLPGQQGNTAYFGHSSNNIFNPGKYKFAFVLLHTMQPGDDFYLIYGGHVYTYQVFQTSIVPPSDVSVLSAVAGHTATATLITCDPPGTSINRLVVWGDQISPDPGGNTAPSQTQNVTQPSQLASNGPSLWSRFTHWLF